jgi:hypothetical protein
MMIGERLCKREMIVVFPGVGLGPPAAIRYLILRLVKVMQI